MSNVKRNSVKQWFDDTLYSRLDSKKDDVIIILMQRVHVDDLVGRTALQPRNAGLNVNICQQSAACLFS